MARTILHIDLDAFFCSVEEKLDSSLTGTPFAVGGSPQGRGVITSCSYAARQLGIRAAMPAYVAINKCPTIKLITPKYKLYTHASGEIMKYLYSITPIIEQVSIDEAFLDASEFDVPRDELARKIQAEINHTHKLPCSIGVASNKLVAKIANDYGKSQHKGNWPPNKITIVDEGQEENFLAPLPVDMLWGVGPKTANLLAEINIKTIGDLANAPEYAVIQTIGKYGKIFINRAKGVNESHIKTTRHLKSISNETTFAKNTNNINYIRDNLVHLSRKVGKRLREADKQAKTVKIKIRWSDFGTITRQISFINPISTDEEIFAAAEYLLGKHTPQLKSKQIRLLGVGVCNLVTTVNQLNLWDHQPI